MSRYTSTCSLSGLPISPGDPVRWFLLTRSSLREGQHFHCSTDLWCPRTPPVRGIYNGYGNVEGVRDRAGQGVVLAGLRVDLVERGWGNNTCHDFPVRRRGLTWDRMLLLAWEGRLRVRDRVGWHDRLRRVPHGVPTRRRVERLLRKLNLSGAVAEHDWGVVSVRPHAFGSSPEFPPVGSFLTQEDDILPIAEALLPYYHTTITRPSAGTNVSRVRVTAHVPVAPPQFPAGSRQSRPLHLTVTGAMVREDVWSAALQTWEEDDGMDRRVEYLRELVRTAPSPLPVVTEEKEQENPGLRSALTDIARGWVDEYRYVRETGWGRAFVLGLGATEPLLNDQIRAGELDVRDPGIERVLRAKAELELILEGGGRVGHVWHPVNCGPAEPLWAPSAAWLRALGKVADRHARSHRRDRG